MKMIVCFVHNDDARTLMKELTGQGFSVTRLASTGGFLHGGNATLLLGVEDDAVDRALAIIKEKSSVRKEYMALPAALPGYGGVLAPVQVTIGGSTVFVINIEQAYKH